MKMFPGHIEDLMSQVKTKYKVKKFTNYQYRINDVVDIYPVNSKYHILKTNKRGSYNDLYMFLDDMFKPKVAQKPTEDIETSSLNIIAFDLKTLKNAYLFGFLFGVGAMSGMGAVVFIIKVIGG